MTSPSPKIEIRLLSTEETQDFYVNCFEVSANFSDITIHFGKVPSKMSPFDLQEIGERNILEVSAMLQITISPPVLPQLIRALTAQKIAYEQLFGELKELANG